uniref:Uncharacterized protein n=1 Tax=Anguilla anguilla TaxID=7936 RepID=A0A0E9SPC8_ANGAN
MCYLKGCQGGNEIPYYSRLYPYRVALPPECHVH